MVKLLAEADEIHFENLFIDGTKIEANANKYTFVWKGFIEKSEAKLQEKATKYLISENYRKQSLECLSSQLIGQPVEYTFYAFLCTVFEKEDQHEVAFPEYKSQQRFP